MTTIACSAYTTVDGHSVHNRRRNQRVVVPVIRIAIGGQVYTTVDWGLGGFLVAPYTGPLKPDQEFAVSAIGPGDGELVPLAIRARAVRVARNSLAAAFVELGDKAFNFLEALMMRRRKFLEAMVAKARAVA